MVQEKQERLETVERYYDGRTGAGIKLVVVDDNLNLHCYHDGKLMFKKTLSRPEAMTLAYKILGALRNGSEHTRK